MAKKSLAKRVSQGYEIIDAVFGSPELVCSDGVKEMLLEMLDALTETERGQLNTALKMGGYAAWRFTDARKSESKTRNQKRAFILVYALMGRRHAAVVAWQTTLDEARRLADQYAAANTIEAKLKLELADVNVDYQRMANMLNNAWGGWDKTDYRTAGLRLGAAIGQFGHNGPGSIGAFVRRNGDATGVYILSNAHVMQAAGTEVKILQPSHLLGGTHHHVVADVVATDRTVDACIAKVRPGIRVVNASPGNGIQVHGVCPADEIVTDLRVAKHGCATRLRAGVVVNAAMTHTYTALMMGHQWDYRPGEGMSVQVRKHDTDPYPNLSIQGPGDSGSGLYTLDGRFVALMSLGDRAADAAGVGTRAQRVLEALNITLLAEGEVVAA